jgi:hypothetical protein
MPEEPRVLLLDLPGRGESGQRCPALVELGMGVHPAVDHANPNVPTVRRVGRLQHAPRTDVLAGRILPTGPDVRKGTDHGLPHLAHPRPPTSLRGPDRDPKTVKDLGRVGELDAGVHRLRTDRDPLSPVHHELVRGLRHRQQLHHPEPQEFVGVPRFRVHLAGVDVVQITDHQVPVRQVDHYLVVNKRFGWFLVRPSPRS